ncbi:MAG TPA: hypothetical protein ENN11_04350, partial [Methanomicrobia archaeon]|nr:hypothetical protein [Methanomicrobia archaeon]
MALEILGLGLTALLAAVVIFFVVMAFFIWVGAKFAAIKNASFGNAFVSAIGITILTIVLGAVLALLNITSGGLVGPLISVLVTVWVIKSVFDTNWGRAFIAWIFSIIGAFIVGI